MKLFWKILTAFTLVALIAPQSVTMKESLDSQEVLRLDEHSKLEKFNEYVMDDTRTDTFGAISYINRTILIPPSESYYIYLDEDNEILVEKDVGYKISSLPQAARDAIDLVPVWLKNNFTTKLINMGTNLATTYGNLVLNLNDPDLLDEVVFAVTHTATNVLQNPGVSPQVFVTNAEYIYLNDLELDYVEVTEKNDPVLGQYTTLTYTNSSGASMEIPKDIYYWYVVHPKISDELPAFVDPATGTPTAPPNGKFWRDYLFNHNDPGYPLLKDALSNDDRVWKERVNNKTNNGVIGNLTQWIQDVMDFQVQGNRPIQPVAIYNKHMGFCGEHGDISCAVARTVLIPSTNVNIITEDHVWNEFWEGRWVHWEPVNPYIDDPRIYDRSEGGWGRNITSAWAWRGDGYIVDVTERYTDTCTFRATVHDSNGRDVDDGVIWVVTGLYNNPQQLLMTAWGHSDSNGQFMIKLGDHKAIYSCVDSSLGEDPADQGGNEMVDRIAESSIASQFYDYTFAVPGAIQIPDHRAKNNDPFPKSSFKMDVQMEVIDGYNTGQNLFTDDIYFKQNDMAKNVDFYLCNGSNFQRFTAGNSFDSYEVTLDSSGLNLSHHFIQDDDWFAVVSNEDTLGTYKMVEISVALYQRQTLEIISPADQSDIALGDTVVIEGTTQGPFDVQEIAVSIDGGEWTAAEDVTGRNSGNGNRMSRSSLVNWEYQWNTQGFNLGAHSIRVKVNYTVDEMIKWMNITLFDNTPPILNIQSPENLTSFKEGEIVVFHGEVNDSGGLDSLIIDIENHLPEDITSEINASAWSYVWNTSNEFSGEYDIHLIATDIAGNTVTSSIYIEILESAKPFLDIVSPLNNSVFPLDDDITIEGTVEDNGQVAILEAILDGDEDHPIDLMNRYYPPDWSVELEADEHDLEEGVHSVLIRVIDAAGNDMESSVNFWIDTTPPKCNISTPENHTIYASGEIIHLEGFVWDDHAISHMELQVEESQVLEGAYVLNITADLLDDGKWEFDYDPKDLEIFELSSGPHRINVVVRDLVGLEVISHPLYVTIDALDPEIIFFDFSLDRDYEKKLDDDEINMDIKEAFSDHGITLSAKAEIEKKNNEKWVITDGDFEYHIIIEEEWISVTNLYPNPKLIGETVWINGSAWDDVELKSLEIKISNGEWKDISDNLTDGLWKHEWPDAGFNEGTVSVYIRVTDIKDKSIVAETKVDFITISTDTDQDGMPDWWEIKYGLNWNKDDSQVDPDRDKYPNIDEYLGDDGISGGNDSSDPTDRNSYPDIKLNDGKGDGGFLSGKNFAIIMIILVVIIIIAAAAVIATVLVKRRKKLSYEQKAYAMWADPMLDAHKKRDKFKYDEKGELIHDGDIGEGGAGEQKQDGDIEFDDEEVEKGKGDSSAGKKRKPLPPPPVAKSGKKGVVAVDQNDLPAHLQGDSKLEKTRTCENCGTLASFKPDENCYWCDNCNMAV